MPRFFDASADLGRRQSGIAGQIFAEPRLCKNRLRFRTYKRPKMWRYSQVRAQNGPKFGPKWPFWPLLRREVWLEGEMTILQQFYWKQNFATKSQFFEPRKITRPKYALRKDFFKKPHCLYSFGAGTFSWTKIWHLVFENSKNGQNFPKTWQVSAVKTLLQYRIFRTQGFWVVFKRFLPTRRHG